MSRRKIPEPNHVAAARVVVSTWEQAHTFNAVRDEHLAELNAATSALAVWEGLTGLTYPESLNLARSLAKPSYKPPPDT